MKRVLSIQDLSCVGKCSLTVTLPVLSAMQCACSVLPTAILSTHTAFPDPHRRLLTEDIAPILRHWQSVGATFDAVSVGYLASPEQADAILPVLDAYDRLIIIDPVMGDHGKLYSGITPTHISAMKRLCRKGNVLLPNVTEAAFLTGLPYRKVTDTGYLRELTAGMLEFGADAVVITGIAPMPGRIGFCAAGKQAEPFVYANPRRSGKFHGTGDLFSAVFTGAYVGGKALADAATLAARFTEDVIAASGDASPFGVAFESQLPRLWEPL